MDRDKIIISATKKGSELADTLAEYLKAEIRIPMRYADESQKEFGYAKSVSEMIASVYDMYPTIILIMAVGHAVRNLASVLRNRQNNPMVIVIDEEGRFVISLFLGDWSGAEQLVKDIAALLGGTPIITTSADISRFPSLDIIAKEHGLFVEQPGLLPKFTAAINNEEQIVVWDRLGLKQFWPDYMRVETERFPKLSVEEKLVVNIGFEEPPISAVTILLVALRPVCLVVGIDSAKNLSGIKISGAIRRYFREHYLSIRSISALATLDSKANDAGLIEACKELNVPLIGITKEEIETSVNSEHNIKFIPNKIVPEKICELFAIVGSEHGDLVGGKMDLGQINLAVAMNPSLIKK